MIEAILLAVAGLYLLEYCALHIGQRRMTGRVSSSRDGVSPDPRPVRRVPPVYPLITVLVAARNEERVIEECLEGLLAQDYPAERMQIIVVDDESDDATNSIIARVAAAHPGRIELLTTREEPGTARGKVRAIAQGMDHARGEIVLLTDADCMPPRTWARATVEYFTPETGLSGGFTIVAADDMLSSLQQLDWVHLQTLGSAALGLGFVVGVIGNNFAFRREAYEAVGGYRAIPFSITEDFALCQAMTSAGYREVYPCDPEAYMVTHPCATLMEVLRQKQRWARGGTKSTVSGYTLFIVALLIILAFSIAPFVSLRAWAIVWAVKFACDLLLIGTTLRTVGLFRQLRWLFFFEFYFVVQLALIPLLLLNKTVVWKGRAFR